MLGNAGSWKEVLLGLYPESLVESVVLFEKADPKNLLSPLGMSLSATAMEGGQADTTQSCLIPPLNLSNCGVISVQLDPGAEVLHYHQQLSTSNNLFYPTAIPSTEH